MIAPTQAAPQPTHARRNHYPAEHRGAGHRPQPTLVIPLLPNIPELLNAPAASTGWLVTITLLTGVITTPIIKRCADMFGKRRMLIVSLAMMVTGALNAAL